MKNKFLDETQTTVTDDPRKIPIKPPKKGKIQTTVLQNGRIIDGTGKPVFLGHVVIKGNKIEKVLAENETDWDEKATVVNCAGKTVIPGLIDLHVHLAYTNSFADVSNANSECDSTLRALDRMKYYIESGITSVRDAGSPGAIPFKLKKWSADNKIAGPRIFAAGCLITSTGGHGAEGMDQYSPMIGTVIEREGPDQWRAAVRDQFKKGADFIKTGSHFSKEEIKAAVDAAHALGLKVTTDAERHFITWAVEEGIDMIEHPLPRSDEAIKLMADKGVESIPTLVAYDVFFDTLGGYYGSSSRRFTFSKEANLELCRKMKDAGIKMGVGTDLVLTLYTAYADFYYHELLNFQQLGYSNLEIISIATKVNAEILTMDDKLGTLAPGKLADVTIIEGNPDENLAAVKKVHSVYKDGNLLVNGGKIHTARHPQPSYEMVVEGFKKQLANM